MNEEIAQMFQADAELANQEAEEAKRKAEHEKRKANEKFLNECKCFKDLLLGKEKEFAECKDYIIKYMFNLIQLGGPINADFVAGVRMCLEMLEELPGKWDRTFENLGKEG